MIRMGVVDTQKSPSCMAQTLGRDVSITADKALNCLDGFYSYDADCHIMPVSVTDIEHPNEIYQTIGQKDYNNNSTSASDDGAWWSGIDSLPDDAVLPQLDFEDGHLTGILTPFINQLAPVITQESHDTATDTLYDRVGLSTDCYETTGGIIESSSPTPVTSIQPDASYVSQAQASLSSKKRRRKQNHSCDPCRLAKRACDLSPSADIHNHRPSKGCSTCNTRGLECTASWLANIKSNQHDTKRARRMSYIPGVNNAANDGVFKTIEGEKDLTLLERLTTVSAPESNLTRQIAAQQTCKQQFNLYVDIWEMPMMDCLSHAGMSPSSSCGFEALTKLSTSAYFSKYFGIAQSWIMNYWQMASSSWDTTSAAPHLFFVVAMLDALFQPKGGPTARISTETREASINEALRWVALATAAQFALGKDDCDKSSSRARDLASTAWRKARQLVFENIAATKSFRLALALLLFGAILAPTPTNANSLEDAAYAQSEGVRRLQSLCAQGRLSILETHQSKTQPFRKDHPVQAFPSQVRELILELISIVASLANIFNWVGIGSSRGQIYSSPPDTRDSNITDEDSLTDAAQGAITHCIEGMTRHEQEIHGIAMQIRAKEKVVTMLWRQGVKEEVVLRAVRDSVSIVVMLWKSLAILTVAVQNVSADDAKYEEIRRQYTSICTLIDAWRSAFGTFDENMSLSIQHSGPTLRRSVLFCSNDGDLAVLQLYEVVHQLEIDLAQQPPTPAKECLWRALQSSGAHREENRRISAMQISFLAASCQGLSSPGFQGKGGLKAYVQDIVAHPHPNLMILALSLAAKTFNDEVNSCLARMDMQGASAMMVQLDACLKGLRGLKENLPMFPDIGHTV